MKKINTLFTRDPISHRVVNEVTAGADWVIAGEGVATRKWDGTCCLIRDGKLYKRYDAKRGKEPPLNFEPAQEPDPNTGHWPGWVPVGDEPDSKWHREALNPPKPDSHPGYTVIEVNFQWPDGTYELIGPKVGGNPENAPRHFLMKHGIHFLNDCPTDFASLPDYIRQQDIEGIVWHHPDGRMVKIKGRDFGIYRPKQN